MYQPVLRPGQSAPCGESAKFGAQAMIDLAQYGLHVAAPIAALLVQHPDWPDEEEAAPLLACLLTTVMAPLERNADWAPMAQLLHAVDRPMALALIEVLVGGEATVDPHVLSDATVAMLAGLLDAAGRPGKALAMLDAVEGKRGDPRFMALSWQARCHILDTQPTITALWSPYGAAGAGNSARHHAQERRLEEALSALAILLDEAHSQQTRSELGADLAVIAAWLHGQGQAFLLEACAPITCHLTMQPELAREALCFLLRTPANPAWEPMRESWLEAARCYFLSFMPGGRHAAQEASGGPMPCLLA